MIGNGTRDVNDIMPGSDGLRILELEKNSLDSTLEEARGFLIWARPVSVYTMPARWSSQLVES